MEVIVLSISYTLLKDEESLKKIEEVIAKYPSQLFCTESNESSIVELINKYKGRSIPYYPSFPRFKKKIEAYQDRAERIVKYGTACYCFVDVLGDTTMGPLFIAIEFQKLHPNYILVIYIKLHEGFQKINLTKLKEVFKWDT